MVRELADIGLQSAYHHCCGQKQGAEANPTFYLQRKLEKAYHIDYIFVPIDWLNKSFVTIGKAEHWLTSSDHMPLSLQIQKSQ